MQISVCMATYNGEKYIAEQLESILKQLTKEDELVISDDGSKDKTIEIIKRYQKKSQITIKIFEGPKKGVIKNFEHVISKASKDLIFLSDQDDIWKDNKVEEVKKIFNQNKNITLVIHEAFIVDGAGKITGKKSKYQKGILKNILKNTYIGCCMAFKKEIETLPFPKDIPMHDSWIGIVHEKLGQVYHLDKELFYYRVHGQNYTKVNSQKILKKFLDRLVLSKNTLLKKSRKKNNE
ncbi:glycosyltransferase family 2 protein [Cetobacterium sp.]|uniref:glycosyltransferase family 2 protein n=1 Tax=Cetobacterium sp. TaxID=2071632 RepID=UPI003F30BF59